MDWFKVMWDCVITLNTVLAVVTVFRQHRDISTTWAWLLVLVMLPVIGFILYLFTGRGLGREKIFNLEHQDRTGLAQMIASQRKDDIEFATPISENMTANASSLVHFFEMTDQAPLTKRNKVEIFTDGEEKFAALFKDIRQAKHSIHVEYYTIYNDQIGNELLRILEQKAKEGVEVRVLYDAFGSHGTTAKWFRTLESLGGQAATFITSHNSITKTRLNYHVHRKIVVVDGQIGYTGGFNVGDQYLGRSKKFGYWRDTHLRIIGTGVMALQTHFIMDWNASVKEDRHLNYQLRFFPTPLRPKDATTALQIVTSGPSAQKEQIKSGYIKMISMAKKNVWIQSPYLVPDESVLSALTIAAESGIDVRIMIPNMPDHPFIYRATQYYAKILFAAGVKIYIYEKGFLHAKTVVTDGKLATVGSANQDFRSYKLNFEVNAFLYDIKVARQLARIFEKDMTDSRLLTQAEIDDQSRWLVLKQNFSRLLSPVL
ncbi:cardiolipin synthase [Loigolactobacillus backii]|uniref:cardiolipin synthase n=1 Tax=Loigolactobacillus backii TaxID=375175 RepID=UPI0007F0E94D|nr:cardiolipin synthase [Loigolactobacillus backii]ANK60317.1 cardiolipin synthase [Loigolactobacillus backii]ANK65197.1 cardiolipin synthase [Loigolactobacillus backii]ANK67756.1 cardiolipin synthase [Loigolactobacillus backii]OLF70485.1 cardiolipin synthase [Loigolactobacillus backii]PIO87018.1 cardiolipin synthase [Loigolactobacillus backii]